MLFHLGVLRLLKESGQLEQVGYISCVSGGSILAAHLALHWKEYCGDGFEVRASELIRFAQRNVRGRILLRSLYGALIQKGPLQFAIEQYKDLYGAATLGKLSKNDAPKLWIMGTSLNTGQPCAFSQTNFWIKKEGNPYESPGVPCSDMPVAEAVAASAAFPLLFAPLPIGGGTPRVRGLAEQHLVTDGGVYDNLGAEILEELRLPISQWIICDAQARLVHDSGLDGDKIFRRNMRTSDLLMEQVTIEREDKPQLPRTVLSIRKEVEDTRLSGDTQLALTRVRTDLDRFSSPLCGALVRHGYSVARSRLKPDAPAPDNLSWQGLAHFADPVIDANRLDGDRPQKFFNVLSASDPVAWLSLLASALVCLGGAIFLYLILLRPWHLLRVPSDTRVAREIGPGVQIAQRAYGGLAGRGCCLVRDKTSGTLHLLTAASVVQGLEASIVSALRKPLRLLLPQHLQGQVAGCIQSPPLQVNPGEGICIGQAGATSGGAALIDLDPNLGVTNLPLDSTWHIHKASAHPPESAKVEIATDGGRLLAHIDSQATQSACGLAGQLRLKLSPSQTIGGEQLAGLAGTPVLAAKGNVKELVAIVTCASDGMLYAEPILQVLANLGVELVETREYPGACDASAIAAVGEGFLAASDERISSPSRDGRGNEKKKNAIRVYRSLNDKPAIAELSRYKDEIDIEGAAFDFKSNDRIFWIGSLGLDRHGEPARQRDCLIATDLAGQETTTRCRELREQICAALKLSGGDCAKWDGAVEGLTMHEDGSLLLGLRRPLLGDRELNKKAFILKLTNPSLPDETPVFQVLSVYLKGQGIRAMETTTGKGLRRYYLISGPSERVSYSNFSERAMFHLYEWDGKEGGMGLQEVEFPYGSAGGAYEGLMFDKNTGRLWASRDSDHLSDQFPCKDRKSEEQSYLMVDLGQNLRKKGAPMPGPQVEK